MRLRVATLNVWALPEPLGFRVNRRMRAIGERLPQLGLDVVAFQEVWRSGAREALVAAGRGAGLRYAWHRSGSFRDGGLLVLSRLPILDARYEPFTLPGRPPRADHPDYYAGKGFLQVRLSGDTGPFHVFDTHLHARYSKDVSHEYEAYRVGQVVQLALALREVREPLVVAGDFNLLEASSEYRILAGLSGLRDVASELDQREPTVYDAHPLKKTRRDRRIDYLFVRDGGGVRIQPRSVERAFDDVFQIRGLPASYSDHAGVVTEVGLSPSPTLPLAPADPEAVRLALHTLREGRAETQRRRQRDRLAAGVGLGGAVLATAGVRDPRLTRRRLLRASLRGAGVLAMAPALGFAVLSEVFAPGELRAFEELASRLDPLA